MAYDSKLVMNTEAYVPDGTSVRVIIIGLTMHEGEWCVFEVGRNEDTGEWHYQNFERALERYNAKVKVLLEDCWLINVSSEVNFDN